MNGEPASRPKRIVELAAAVLAQTESLERDQTLANVTIVPEEFDAKSGMDFNQEVRRFEVRLLSKALQLTNGNQAHDARILGIGTTTLGYKVSSYELL